MSDDRPLVIGLAGGVGSGKSTVARAFARLGCAVVDSDVEARAALRRPEVIRELVSWWGEGVLDDEGAIDRSAVARIVFEDSAERERLEGLIHPLVRRSRANAVEVARGAGAPCVIVDAPLLFEAGLDEECDVTVFVDTDRSVRLERVRSRGWDAAELDRREAAQWPLEKKRALCDEVVVNSGDKASLEVEVKSVFDRLMASRGA